jgi:hypothetical protein
MAVDGIPVTRYWLIPAQSRPKMFMPHPSMSPDEIRDRTQNVWNRFYSLKSVWKRSACVTSLRSRLAFVFISKRSTGRCMRRPVSPAIAHAGNGRISWRVGWQSLVSACSGRNQCLTCKPPLLFPAPNEDPSRCCKSQGATAIRNRFAALSIENTKERTEIKALKSIYHSRSAPRQIGGLPFSYVRPILFSLTVLSLTRGAMMGG